MNYILPTTPRRGFKATIVKYLKNWFFSYLLSTPPSKDAFRHSGGDKRLCTSATVTLYFDVELRSERRPGTEQNTSAGDAPIVEMTMSFWSGLRIPTENRKIKTYFKFAKCDWVLGDEYITSLPIFLCFFRWAEILKQVNRERCNDKLWLWLSNWMRLISYR